jgi:hypothetical protein
VKSAAYDTVTFVPVLIPADLLPGERPSGKQTFHIWSRPFSLPGRKSETALPKPPSKLPKAEKPVLLLRATDLAKGSHLGGRIWKILGKVVRRHLTECLALGLETRRRKSIQVLANFYKELQMQLWGDLLDEEVAPRRKPTTARALELWKWQLDRYLSRSRSRARNFADEMEKAGAHQTVVAGLASQALREARLVLWWSGKQFIPAIWCEDLEAAVYAVALPMFGGSELLGLCPRCKQIFVRKRSDNDYCTPRHREADRVARWRQKQKKARLRKRADLKHARGRGDKRSKGSPRRRRAI